LVRIAPALAILFLWALFRRGVVNGRTLLAMSSLYALFALIVIFGFSSARY